MKNIWGSVRARVGATAAVAIVAYASAASAQTRSFDIPAQAAATGVKAFAAQADVQVAIAEDAAQNHRTNSVKGAFSVERGMQVLLEGTGLVAQQAGPGVFSVILKPQPTTTEADPTEDVPELTEVVVTAQKRSENLQAVPSSVTAFKAGRLAEGNVTDLQGITTLDTSLIIGEGTGQAMPFLRGVGTLLRGVGNEASTSIYVDGFYYSRIPAAMFELNNIEQVEVLKGPQGTLFGRNSEGGLVNIITRDPGRTPALEASLGYGNFNTTRANVYAATPIGDQAALDLSVLSVNQGEGWGRDIVTGFKTGYEDATVVRTKLVVSPADGTDIKVSADYIDTRSTDGLSSSAYAGTTQGYLVPAPNPVPTIGFNDIQSTLTNVAVDSGWSVGARIQQDLGFANLVSLTGYRKTQESILQGAAAPVPTEDEIGVSIHDFNAQTSQELQLVSTSQSPLDWIVGLYFLHQNGGQTPEQEYGAVFRGATLDIFSTDRDTSYAGFGQINYNILPSLKLTLGARYTTDQVSASGWEDKVTSAAYVDGAVMSGSKDFDKTTYKTALDYQVNPDTIAYVSYSTGFKAGMFLTTPPIVQPLNPETMKAYEIGEKTEFFDHRLRLNAALFYYDIYNYQVQAVDVAANGTITGTYVNAPLVHSKGFDMNGEAAITRAFSTTFGLTLMDARFNNFPDAPYYIPLSTYPFGNSAEQVASADGHYLPRSPKVSANLGFNYRLQTAIGPWVLSPNYSYHSSYYWDPDNQHRQSPVGLLDTTVSYSPMNSDNWTLRLWGKNLTDVRYYFNDTESAGASGTAAVVAPPRTYGVSFNYKY